MSLSSRAVIFRIFAHCTVRNQIQHVSQIFEVIRGCQMSLNVTEAITSHRTAKGLRSNLTLPRIFRTSTQQLENITHLFIKLGMFCLLFSSPSQTPFLCIFGLSKNWYGRDIILPPAYFHYIGPRTTWLGMQSHGTSLGQLTINKHFLSLNLLRKKLFDIFLGQTGHKFQVL